MITKASSGLPTSHGDLMKQATSIWNGTKFNAVPWDGVTSWNGRGYCACPVCGVEPITKVLDAEDVMVCQECYDKLEDKKNEN
jgi:hypothetical protein